MASNLVKYALDACSAWTWWDGRITIVGLVILPLLVTYLITSISAYVIKSKASSGQNGARPPPMPYLVPLLGNTFQFATKPESFLTNALKRFGKIPFRLLVGGETYYFMPPGEAVLAMFKASRDLTSKPLSVVSLRDQFNVPPADMKILYGDDSGVNPKPAEGFETMDPAHRIFHIMHTDLHTKLNGTALDAMMDRMVTVFSARLQAAAAVSQSSSRMDAHGWTCLPDLYQFLRDEMFRASTETLCGSLLLHQSPSFVADFWTFDSHMLALFGRVPRWLAPSAHAARDRALAAVKLWRQTALARFDYTDTDLFENAEWDPLWGTRLVRHRSVSIPKAGLSDDAGASFELGLIWGTNANAIPAAMWTLLGILQDPSVTARVLAEVLPCFDDSTGRLDPAKLYSQPLLTSAYMEALRMSSATTAARAPLSPNITLAGWTMERPATLLSLSWFAHHDDGFWNSDDHPLDTFWAERFLEYPDDPASGPIRKTTGDFGTKPTTTTRERSGEDDKTAKVVTSGIQGFYYPYGGGTKMCPGRFFAKQEIMSCVAMMLREFDIELEDRDAACKTRPDMHYFPIGVLPPDRPVPVRMRRRGRRF
ncbi:cytochrome P450 [Bombardia bombarda]|uniref:Cytochrome P450 n=1 Tax=Bombardia bombarda TaxID=252184 RepID=A0AA39TKH7_9PEZI|nr:cytochrome P450 [Bombardia bombarda]